MPPTYYVIELSARWLTALLVALALALVMAFAFGYGAAWSVLSGQPGTAARPVVIATPTPVEEEVVLATPAVTPSVETPTVVATPEVVATQAVAATATRPPRPTATPVPTIAPSPKPTRAATAVPASADFWVQVVAVSSANEIPALRSKLEKLDFPRSHQRLVESEVAGGGRMYKLQIGPFPERGSADRVVLRMQAVGFPDAWVVAP